MDFTFITDRLAVGDVASRAMPGFVAVVSLLATAPVDELEGAPSIPAGPNRYKEAIRADTCGRDGLDLGSKSDAVIWWHIDINDGEGPGSPLGDGRDLVYYLDDATTFIANHIRRGCVLVHCGAGKSRSVSVVIAYLCRYAGMSYTEALSFVKARRMGAAPADCFASAVKRWLNLDELAVKGPTAFQVPR